MGIVVRQGVKSSIVTYIGTLLGAVTLLWLFPKILDPEEIGLIRVLLEIGFLFALLSSFGISNIADKFFSFFNDEEKKHKGFFLLLIVYPLAGYLIVFGAFFLLRNVWIAAYQERSYLLVEYFFHIFPLTFFMMYLMILEAYSRVHYRIVIPAAVREVFLRLFWIAAVVLYHHEMITLDHLVWLIILSYLTGVLLMAGYLKKLNRLYLSALFSHEDRTMMKQIIVYGLYIFMGSVSGLVASKIDILMLSHYSLAFTGIYSVAFYIAAVIEIPRRSISLISSPLVAKFWKENDIEGIEGLYRKTSLNQLIIGLLLFLLIWSNVDEIFALMPNSEIYSAGKYVILAIGLSRLVDMATGINSEIILTSPFYKYNLLFALMSAVLMAGGCYLLIPLYGIDGAAWAVLLNFIVLNIIKLLIIKVKAGIQPFSFRTVLVLGIASLSYFIILIIPWITADSLFTGVLNMLLKSGLILVIFAGSVLFLKISEDLNKLIIQGFEFFKKA